MHSGTFKRYNIGNINYLFVFTSKRRFKVNLFAIKINTPRPFYYPNFQYN